MGCKSLDAYRVKNWSYFQSIGQSICLSVCPSDCLSVCLFARLFTFEVPFKRLFAPTSQVGCPKFLESQNPLGKVMERSGLTLENFY